MNGMQAAREIRKLSPKAPIIIYRYGELLDESLGVPIFGSERRRRSSVPIGLPGGTSEELPGSYTAGVEFAFLNFSPTSQYVGCFVQIEAIGSDVPFLAMPASKATFDQQVPSSRNPICVISLTA